MTIRNIKDEILGTAHKMFLEKTYDEVAMRDIAEALGISVGNLTYHFNKKDDLAEAVVLDMFSRYELRPPCRTLPELDAWIAVFEKAGDEETFYFKDFEKLARIGKKVRHIQKEVFEGNMQFWHETLKVLIESGIMQPEGFDGQFDAFIHNFYLMKASFNKQNPIEEALNTRKTGLRFRAWAFLYPMLTAKGKRVFKEKIKLMA